MPRYALSAFCDTAALPPNTVRSTPRSALRRTTSRYPAVLRGTSPGSVSTSGAQRCASSGAAPSESNGIRARASPTLEPPKQPGASESAANLVAAYWAVIVAVSKRVAPAMRSTLVTPRSLIAVSTSSDSAAVPPISSTWAVLASRRYSATSGCSSLRGVSSTGTSALYDKGPATSASANTSPLAMIADPPARDRLPGAPSQRAMPTPTEY